MQATTTAINEDFGEGHGKVPQETLDYFHDLEEETMRVLAIEMTSTHCKGVEYDLPEKEAVKGIKDGLFVNATLNALMDENAPKPEEQKTYNSDGSDKETVVNSQE